MIKPTHPLNNKKFNNYKIFNKKQDIKFIKLYCKIRSNIIEEAKLFQY